MLQRVKSCCPKGLYDAHMAMKNPSKDTLFFLEFTGKDGAVFQCIGDGVAAFIKA